MKKIWRFSPLIGYYGFIFYLSSRSPSAFYPFPFSDKVFHIIEYIPLGFFTLFAIRERISWFWMLSMLLMLASLDELHQKFVPGRNPEILDVIADMLGGVIGIYLYKFLRRLRSGEQTG